jgi:predicted RNase H-like HicB family nuclease
MGAAQIEKPYYVHAVWDEEAKVWVASSEDVPGLATEAETTEALVEKLKSLIPELLAANGRTDAKPIAFELLTRRFELAA